MSTQLRVATVACALIAAFAPAVGRADGPQLIGTVGTGDAYTISLADANGARVTQLPPGSYTLLVHDNSTVHDFHLRGPGVDVATEVETVGDQTFTVTLSAGTYTYVCDPHAGVMHGSLTVGDTAPPTTTPPATAPPTTTAPAATAPTGPSPTTTEPSAPSAPPTTTAAVAARPAPVTVHASVGPGRRIALTRVGGARVRRLRSGRVRVVVRDATRRDNLHLRGPGVSRRTGVASTGTATWSLTLRAGAYRLSSDAHPSLRLAFSVR